MTLLEFGRRKKIPVEADTFHGEVGGDLIFMAYLIMRGIFRGQKDGNFGGYTKEQIIDEREMEWNVLELTEIGAGDLEIRDWRFEDLEMWNLEIWSWWV